jgi:hypothetical protein
MYKLIISIFVGIIVYVLLGKKNNIEKLAANPKKPEKCFFDFDLLRLHSIFVSALEQDITQLKRVKAKILPSVCILNMVVNRKIGWDKFLDSQGNKFGISSRQDILKKYLNDEYDKVYKYVKDQGLDFLTQPYKIKVKKEFSSTPSTTPGTTTASDIPVEEFEEITINILEEMQKVFINKVPTDI